jgi:hypothetical protein
MPIAEQTEYQSARVLFYDPRRGFGKAVTSFGRRVDITFQSVKDAGVITLERGAWIEVQLDAHRPARIERMRVPERAPIPAPPKKRTKGKQ